MAPSGPFGCGGAFRRNVLSMSWSPIVNVPAGAFVILCVGTNAPDTTVFTVNDGAGNSYFQQVGSQQPGSGASLFVFLAQNASAIAMTRTITLTSDHRADFVAAMYYFTGALGSLSGTDVEWNSSATPHYTVSANDNDSLFAALGVAGASTDGFTQDPNGWGADIPPGFATTTFTIHACGKTAGAAGKYSWNPTLGVARQSVGLLMSFN
jgi:hypothetical protein